MKILWKIIKFLITTVLIVVVLLGLLIGGLTAYWAYKENQFSKYNGHGFQYMHGYSSTDFKGYHVYDGEKLVKLDHPSDFVIEEIEDMPILDGAEACYPLYAAFAKAVYKDIDQIEAEVLTWGKGTGQELSDEQLHALYCNGRIVSFTNSSVGYKRLIEKEVDLFIGARPSKNQLEDAKQSNETIVSTPIGKEAFVFFVEEDNPINDLSMEDVRKIYSGEIRNWKELGGANQKIIAFQRPENSGSQVMMRYFMGDTEVKEADTIESVSAMGGVIKAVKQYHNEAGAIGYTFRYFLEELNQEDGVKILSIDGVYPSVENIKNGSYPILADLVVSKLESNSKENVDKMIDFMLSEDGQYIVEQTGYGPLK